MHDSTAVGRLKKLGGRGGMRSESGRRRRDGEWRWEKEEGWRVEVGGGGVRRLREVRNRRRGSQGEEVEWDKEKEGYRESRIPQIHKLVHLAIRKFPTQSSK